MSNTDDKKKVVTPRVSVHVVYYSCPNCGNEEEHIQFCEKCGKEMRVIDVVERFGSEAQELIEKLKATIANKGSKETDEEEPNIIIFSDDEDVVNDEDDDANTITSNEVADLDELEDIFAENGASEEHHGNTDDSGDISEISGILDEEDDGGKDLDDLDLDPDDLPTL